MHPYLTRYFAQDVKHLIAEKHITLSERECIGYMAAAFAAGAVAVFFVIYFLSLGK